MSRGGRGGRGAAYTVLTPANHYPCRLPNLPAADVIKLVTPRRAPARFAEYLVTLPAGGGTSGRVAPGFETFLYGLAGEVALEADGRVLDLGPGRFAYLPAATGFALRGATGAASRLLWLKRRYEPFPGLGAPELAAGHRDDEPFDDTAVAGLRRRELLDLGDPRLDFNMSLLAFEPGTGLGKVEIHDEEHGLYMTCGTGEYLLDRDRHTVEEGDFVYMAPYCPQSFRAAGDGPAEYLLYKDVYRDGF
jgi:(S)-ureidoglycine aminohydrolase